MTKDQCKHNIEVCGKCGSDKTMKISIPNAHWNKCPLCGWESSVSLIDYNGGLATTESGRSSLGADRADAGKTELLRDADELKAWRLQHTSGEQHE